MSTVTKTREETFSTSQFEWAKTERAGDICQFSHFEVSGNVEYVVFTDGTRIKTDLIGDIVLVHTDPSQVMGKDLLTARPLEDILGIPVDGATPKQSPISTVVSSSLSDSADSAVIAILDKTKKRNEKLNLTLTVKIPSPDLYAVIKENFDNVDDVLLQTVMDQIDEKLLRESVKKELIAIYQKKRKINQ